jgi:hypothetical protein
MASVDEILGRMDPLLVSVWSDVEPGKVHEYFNTFLTETVPRNWRKKSPSYWEIQFHRPTVICIRS